MKKISVKKSVWLSALSSILFGTFIYIGLGSFGGSSQQVRHLGNGVYETAKYYGKGKTEIITGKQDGHGNHHGKTTIVYEQNGERTHKEEVEMVNGERHGEAYLTYPNGDVYLKCYDHGTRVDCEKSVRIKSESTSASQIFSDKYPWMLFKFNALGIDSGYVESFIDTMETIMFLAEIQEEDFDSLYDEVIGDIDETHFDSLVDVYSEMVLFYGFDLVKKSELRMATIDRYRSGESSTYNSITSVYQNYLLGINEAGISNEDFENFCEVYDSSLTSYGILDTEDPDFIDSLDNRIYRALEYISSDESSESLIIHSLKLALLPDLNTKIKTRPGEFFPRLKQAFLDSGPQTVSEVVGGFMLLKYAEADLIKKSLKEAWNMNKGYIQLPIITTGLLEINSNTSVSVQGNVIEDGGADVTERGIVWAEYYNPTISDHLMNSGTGLGEFSEIISGLEENKTYYARAFATNNAGTAYGNCVEFTGEAATSVINKELFSNFDIFPNPASGVTTFRFSLEIAKNIKLTIISTNGQILLENDLGDLSQGENLVEHDLTSFKNGIYFGLLSDGRQIEISRKFLVAH